MCIVQVEVKRNPATGKVDITGRLAVVMNGGEYDRVEVGAANRVNNGIRDMILKMEEVGL